MIAAGMSADRLDTHGQSHFDFLTLLVDSLQGSAKTSLINPCYYQTVKSECMIAAGLSADRMDNDG